MGNSRWILASAAAFAVALAGGVPMPTHAQGVTTGAVSGLVTDDAGRPLASAQVQVTHRGTGFSTGAMTNANGRYFVQNLEVGGPYSVQVRLLGYDPEGSDGLRIALGQNLQIDFQLTPRAVTLEGVTVRGEASPIFSPSSQGVQTSVTDTALRRLPSFSRNFTDFVQLSPQVMNAGPGISGGGVNNRYNSIQIDGLNSSDLFGLGSTGQPGGQARGKSISLEAVKEYQVLLTPFDVRQGNFAGALINAVTRSGTNNFQGTAFYYFRNNDLARSQDFLAEYDNKQYGFSVGGPIARDRAHFFVTGEWQDETRPAGGPYVGQPNPLPVSEAEITQFANVLEGYGFTPGSAGLFYRQNPNANIFARLDFVMPWNSRLSVRHNYGSAQDDVFSRSTAAFPLTSQGYFFDNETNQSAAQLFTNFTGGQSNEFLVNLTRIRDSRTPRDRRPMVIVGTGSGAELVAGADRFSMGNELDQDILELKNDFAFSVGSQRITIGTQNQFFKIRNLFNRDSYGVYWFADLDSLAAGEPRGYSVSKDLGGGIEVNMKAAHYAAYAQSQWQPTPRLALTYGLRLDIPVLNSKPALTERVLDAFERRTDDVPSGNILWSPRIGFNLDMSGDRQMQLRGGFGMFAGRPAFVWLSNAYQNSGSGLGLLMCGRTLTGSGNNNPPPAFNADPDNQPGTCLNGVGLGTSLALVDLLDPDLKFPQTARLTLGMDREIARGWIATLEGLYTRNVNDWMYVNRNLTGPVGRDRYGRVMYGTLASSGTGGLSVSPSTHYPSSEFGDVIDVVNTSANYSWNLTAGLQRRFANNIEARAMYTYSQVRDVWTPTSSQGISNWRFGRTVGSHPLESQRAEISNFDQPHRLVISGTYSLERSKTDFSVIYLGQSGQPFVYVYNGDVNADRAFSNDHIYVPTNTRSENEIRFRQFTSGGVTYTVLDQQMAFEEFIQSSKCLREQRGKIMERNTCRSPWQNIMNIALRQSLPSFGSHGASLRLEVFNFLNLLNKEWGLQKFQPGFNNITALNAVGYFAPTQQPIVTFNPNTEQFNSRNASSNYQIQLSARYEFF